ncbi:hypothetical protein Trydic_g8309 [Trypoxylus dichotomus]
MKGLAVLVLCVVNSCWALPSLGRTRALPWRDVVASSKTNRIIGGQPAQLGQFPWQVGVIGVNSAGGAWLCGGALVGKSWVLTAAHCVSGAVVFNLYLGGLTISGTEDGRVLVLATDYIAHTGFNNNLNYDIALIRLDSLVDTTDRIAPIRLPQPGTFIEGGTPLVVSGWGKTSQAATGSSPILNYVGVQAITNQECSLVYGSATVIESTLCTRGQTNEGTCSGDSGGPLVSFDEDGVATLQGIVSFGAAAGCDLGYPSGFARVGELLEWIRSSTNNEVVPP